MTTIVDLTIFGPWADDTWTVCVGDYNSENPHGGGTLRRFDTKEQAEAFVAETKAHRQSQALTEEDGFPF